MSMLESLILVLHVLAAVAVCGFVLLQHGKGADMGAAFGSGASGSLFGASGSANFLSRTTAVLALVFFLTSLGLTWLGANRAGPGARAPAGLMEKAPATKAVDIPASTSVPAADPAKAAPTESAPGNKSGDVPK